MPHPEHLAIIGSGASAIYHLKHLVDEIDLLQQHLGGISIYEKSPVMGMGMPYNPQTTDRYNMSNISSEEIPELPVSFGDWLRSQDPAFLEKLGLKDRTITDSEVYSRLALGQYLHAQYLTLTGRLREAGIPVTEHAGCQVMDVRPSRDGQSATVVTADGVTRDFGRIVIATGHYWTGEDAPESGYFASPWPIFKLLPEEGKFHNYPIGTLGASLSAFDVVASLANRHGGFSDASGKKTFQLHPGAEGFKIVMHSAHGLLPHLQFDQEEPFREIYRHVDREGLLGLVNDSGFLRIGTYFDKICRPALLVAFKKDRMPAMVEALEDPGFGLKEFVEKMTDKHDYVNAFEGMRFEMKEAENSVLNHQPVHWKEVIDDLMYTLNFHAELMPAEDHLVLQSTVMPFLLNVIAAMPLPSGNSLLALYDAGCLEMISGRVTRNEGDQTHDGLTVIQVDNEGQKSTIHYRMFIDCSGQKPLEVEDYPFPGLIEAGQARKARAVFQDPAQAAPAVPEEKQRLVFEENGKTCYAIGGVDIDSAYRLVGTGGEAECCVLDIAFPHTTGLRPYSYGLQACSDTNAIVVRMWAEEIRQRTPADGDLVEVTRIYEELQHSAPV